MNFNSLPITSIVSATEEQFIALYQHIQPKEYTQNQFVEEYKSKQTVAMKDAEDLKQVEIAPQQIAKKLQKVIEKANAAYQLTLNSPSNLRDFKRAIFDVEEDGSFRVSGFDLREMRNDECSLCDHKVSGPATYQIENIKTHDKISFPELTLHLIGAHDYFAKHGNYRLDPSKACKVLELVK